MGEVYLPPTPLRPGASHRRATNSSEGGRLKKKMTAAPSVRSFCSTLCNFTRRSSNPSEGLVREPWSGCVVQRGLAGPKTVGWCRLAAPE